MKSILFGFIFLLVTANSNAQNTGTSIVIGHIDTVYSDILNEQREIWIHVPDQQGEQLFSDTYPVLYLLDGDAHFPSVTGLIKQLSSVNGNTLLPKMIVVGIINTDRWRDLTPTGVEEFSMSGGGKLFLDFMENELMPYVEKNYPVTRNGTFVGHSLGGLTVINALVNRPHLFSNYIAIDPSLWWDDRHLLKQSDSVLQSLELKNKSLYVGVANTMQEGMDYTTVMSDTSAASDHIRSILEFTHAVEEYDTDLNFKWKYYNDDSHGSVPLITEYDGLRFLYSWYECDCYKEIMNRDSKLTGAELIDLLSAHYTLVSDKMGYPVLPKEEEMNGLGYWFLEDGEYDKAFSFLNYNVQNYPKSFNVFDSMGDYYVAIGDKENAIKSFEKALELGGFPYTRNKLEEVRGEE